MRKRPILLSIIAWYYIVAGFGTIIFYGINFNNYFSLKIMSKFLLPPCLTIFFMYLTIAINIICGVGMLKGKNWARLLFIAYGIIDTFINMFNSPSSMKMMFIKWILVFIVISFLLYLPNINEYFKRRTLEK